ncbi:MAG TPA: acetolactate synthase large subunit [Rhizomicrobium sp.]|nr:acetolactate synthase large subunit [Rhizomicrobium sp.]
MNGAETLIATLAASGIKVCFANPGTSEMHVVAALDKSPIRPVLALFEGVVTGAADGYGRIAGEPAMSLLHLGPGFANGIANLHNARRAATPIVNIVGDHATWHNRFDSPLMSDIQGICRPVSQWLHSTASARTVAADAARAVAAAKSAPGQIATLIVPADAAWDQAESPAPCLPGQGFAPVSSSTIDRVAQALSNGKRTMLLLRGPALWQEGMDAAGRIAAKSGARLAHDFFAPRVRAGAGRPLIERMPYFAENIVECLYGLEQLILVGAVPPVTFFAYPGRPSWVTPEGCEIITLSHPHENGTAALIALADAIGAPRQGAHAAFERPDIPAGPLNSMTLGQIIARYLPENAIISEEAATTSLGLTHYLPRSAPHDILYITGGAIGQALPVGAGAAIAAPDRKVVTVSGDGGAMYTLQALWTEAREKLDVVTVICANRSYAILNIELMRVGATNPGPKALSTLDIGHPDLDWVQLARGQGVEAERAHDCREFAAMFEDAMRHKGPRLIEAVL